MFRGRMIRLHLQGLTVALASAVVLSGCGGSNRAANSGASARTSIAAAVVAFVAPRDGADAVIGAQLASFAQTVQTKLLGDCMASDGFPAPTFPVVGQPGQVTAEVPPNPTTQRAQVQASLSTLLNVLSFAGLGIGFLTIAAITIMSVAQRRSEIGLRRAVGYRRLEIARLIVLEAAGVGMLGGILGTSIGVLATAAIASNNHWTPVMNTTLVLVAPFLGVAVGVLAGSYPAIRAARITPMAALRA